RFIMGGAIAACAASGPCLVGAVVVGGVALAVNAAADKKPDEVKPTEEVKPPDSIPTEPVGKLTKPTDKWLKDQGVNPHDLKKGQGDSRVDTYVDRAGNIWTLPKNSRDAEPQYQGNLDQFKGD
ncbi:polymorphic toxin type 33 domain-containing protein, partial [Rhodoferax sp.]|uniref:polymorphic toxin type 33 domain-containing protein n=1 Tax=Rhodoferax sp. TaxID=50421 RepID=UPI002747A787|nr:polymorphic toxin type 33 domain-containing protein [Rhodoferax sp.]